MRRPHQPPLPRSDWGLLVEGRREGTYFGHVAQEFNEQENTRKQEADVRGIDVGEPIRTLTVKPSGGGSAAGVLSHARRIAQDFDRTFCVLDGDRLDEAGERALRDAEASGIRVFFSFPCFEVWLLLHF